MVARATAYLESPRAAAPCEDTRGSSDTGAIGRSPKNGAQLPGLPIEELPGEEVLSEDVLSPRSQSSGVFSDAGVNRARSAAPEGPSASRLSRMNRGMSPAAMTPAFPSARFARLPLCRAPTSNPANSRNPVVPQTRRRLRVRTKAGVGFRSSTGFFEGPEAAAEAPRRFAPGHDFRRAKPTFAPHDDPRLFAPWPERRQKLGQCGHAATVPVFFVGVQMRTKKPNRSRTWLPFTVTF